MLNINLIHPLLLCKPKCLLMHQFSKDHLENYFSPFPTLYLVNLYSMQAPRPLNMYMWYSSEVIDPPEGCREALSQEANRSQTALNMRPLPREYLFGQLPITQNRPPWSFGRYESATRGVKNTSNGPKISDGNFGCQKGAVYRGGSLATGSKRGLRLII